MSNKITKIPLYLGLAIFVFSILLTSVRVGENQKMARIESQAEQKEGTKLSLKFIPPEIISVVIKADVDVKEVDSFIKYDPRVINIISDSLVSGPAYSITGSNNDQDKGIFSFTATAQGGIKTEIVANFKVEPKIENTKEIILKFITGADGTYVYGGETFSNILTSAEGVEFLF